MGGNGGFNGPFPMGAGGTDPPIGYDLMNDVGIEGDLVDQRGPHYFDVRAEAVFLDRDTTFERNLIFTVENVVDPIVRLTSGQLNYDASPGFRVIGRYDILPCSVVEFGYTGLYDYESSASFTDPDANLFSLFSNFGDENVFPGVTMPGGPGAPTERALTHRIAIESDLQTAEISYRRYWLGWIPRVSGTLLAGFRYTRLTEEFEFSSIGGETVPFTNPPDPQLPIAALDYREDAENNLAGFQTGGDIWVCLSQGLRIGAEGKAGLYDNHYTLTNKISTNPILITPPTLFEEFKKDQPAFIGEASLDLVADLLRWRGRISTRVRHIIRRLWITVLAK
jgi:hypothetical protein